MFIVDAHLDLSMNAMEWNRDLRSDVNEIRKLEAGMTDKPDRGKATVSLPELRKGKIGLVVATQIARYVAPDNPLPGWHSPQQAWAQTQSQLAWYREMETAGEMAMVKDLDSLARHLARWSVDESGRQLNSGLAGNKGDSPDAGTRAISDLQDDVLPATDLPIGYILSLEGADSLVDIDYLETAWQYGLRAVGPAHYGPGRYANGTDSTGLMGHNGLALLKKIEELNIILDATHLCDDAFWQALDNFHGAVWASHNNCRALVDHNRQFSDDMIRALASRGSVIGAALDAWMMVPGWKRGISTPESMSCSLDKMIDHIDHICQLTGSSGHVGIGTDLDGAFGKEQCPYDLETIADLTTVPYLFKKRGYTDEDVEKMMHGNWLRFIKNTWSK